MITLYDDDEWMDWEVNPNSPQRQADEAVQAVKNAAEAITTASIEHPITVLNELSNLKADLERIELAINRVERRAAA